MNKSNRTQRFPKILKCYEEWSHSAILFNDAAIKDMFMEAEIKFDNFAV